MSPRSLPTRLCLMMFLEYAVRGAWYPFLARYLNAPRTSNGLGFTSAQSAWTLALTSALGAVTAPFVAGQVADRYVNAEKALALLHVLSAVLLYLNADSTGFLPFFCYMTFFSIVYVPTQSLTNSLALSHLEDREHTYPRTRMWGTIGWVVTSSLFTYFVLTSPDPATNIARIPASMKMAAILGLGYAAFSFFFLPSTPPPDANRAGPLISTRAFALLRDPSVLTLTLVALPVSAIHTAFYLNIAPYLSAVYRVPDRMLGPTIAVSQSSEVLFLFILGPLLRRLGYKWMLVIGAASQAVRFAAFAIEPSQWIVVSSLTMHGIAFACFFTTGVLYVERRATPDIRHSAQTVFGIVLFGLGPAFTVPYSQFFDRFVTPAGPNFPLIWWTQTALAIGTALALLIFFRDRTRRPPSGPQLVQAEAAETAPE